MAIHLDFEVFIDQALETMGLKKTDFMRCMEEKFGIDQKKMNSEECDFIFQICDELYLEFPFYISSEERFIYNKEIHLNRIIMEIMHGKYPYKKTSEIKKRLEIQKKQIWDTESEHYSFQLRWNMRINRLLKILPFDHSLNINIPAYDEVLGPKVSKMIVLAEAYVKRVQFLRRNGNLKGFYFYHNLSDAEVVFDDEMIIYKNHKASEKEKAVPLHKISRKMKTISEIALDTDLTIENMTSRFWKEHRERASLTQEQVAKKLGHKSGQLISNWERGKAEPSKKDIAKLLKIYKINVDTYIQALLEYQRKKLFKEFSEQNKLERKNLVN